MSFVEPNQHTPNSSSTNHNVSTKDNRGRPRAQTTGSSTIIPTRGKPLEAVVYRNSIECPVCFLVLSLLVLYLLKFYPPNINRTRCCWKPICTECFVEMKRAEPHYPSNDDNPTLGQPPININPMNLISDPVRCPFCVKTDFGVVYNPPTWLPSERRQDNTLLPPREIATSPLQSDPDIPMDKREEMYPPGHERVVLIDNIRPDWYQALAHRRRVEARRLATATALQQALAVAGQRRRGAASGTRLVAANAPSGLGGVDRTNAEQRRVGRRVDGIVRITRDEADEMMLQEAIRQSLQTEEDERRKREEEERNKANPEGSNSTVASTSTSVPRPTSSTSSSPIPATVLPRLQPSTSTSPPRSIFSAFRTRSGSGSSRNGASLPSNLLSQTTRRPSSTSNLCPPTVNTIRRQPSLPDSLLSSTSTSVVTAMRDSIVPAQDDSRPSISSPLASQAVAVANIPVESVVAESSTPPHTNVTPSSTVEEILPVEGITQDSSSHLKTRGDGGTVEEREVVELTH